MCNSFIFEGKTCLRPINNADKDIFIKWYNNIDIRKDIGGMIPFTEAEFMEACLMKQKINPPSIWFSVCVNGNVVGTAGLHQIKYIQRNSEISILIGEDKYRNKGIATSAIKLLNEYAFNNLQMHRLYACVFSDNKRSIGLFTKCGYKMEGTLKDAAYWNGVYRDVLIFGMVK